MGYPNRRESYKCHKNENKLYITTKILTLKIRREEKNTVNEEHEEKWVKLAQNFYSS